MSTRSEGAVVIKQGPCEPDCGGYADYAAVPCPNPACADRVRRMQDGTDRPLTGAALDEVAALAYEEVVTSELRSELVDTRAVLDGAGVEVKRLRAEVEHVRQLWGEQKKRTGAALLERDAFAKENERLREWLSEALGVAESMGTWGPTTEPLVIARIRREAGIPS
jgi:predicted  nucleic acid-binding Zn-ribbon protein